MENFTYWYAYFDSAFLKVPPVLPSSFFQGTNLKSVLKKRWTKISSLPQLPHLFADLQAFFSAKYWKKCQLEEIQVNNIQRKMNNLLTLIEVQKLYVSQYWSDSKRRVQASLTHYFIFFKQTILCLIPSTRWTLNQTIQAHQCCVDIKHIQKLVNHLLEHLPVIYSFFSSPQFAQQELIIGELFKDITNFCRNLPKLTIQELQHIPKLMKYISLNNSLEFTSKDSPKGISSPLKKIDNSHAKNTKKRTYSKDRIEVENLSSFSLEMINSDRKDSDNKTQYKVQSKRPEDEGENLKLFKFSKTIFQVPDEKTVKTNGNSNKFKIVSKVSLPNATANANIQISPYFKNDDDRMRSVTITPFFKNQSRVIQNQLQTSKRDTFYTDRSRLLTRTASIDVQDKKHPLMLAEEEQVERKQITRKPKPIKAQPFIKISTMIQLNTGKRKGWAVIRQHIFEKIAQRKLKRMLFS